MLGLFSLAVTDFISGVVAFRQPLLVDSGYYYNVMAEDRIVALTFDDGPDPIKTREIMQILDRQEVPATFFFMGSQALAHPEVVKEVYNKGYEIGNHTYTHSYRVHETKERLAVELDVTNKIISNITGEPTLLYRPPFLLDIGSDPIPDQQASSEKLFWAVNDGYLPIGADIDSLDWKAETSQEIIDNVLNNLESGHIVLLHDGGLGLHTTQALEPLIEELKARDYRFGSVSDVIGLNAAHTMLVQQEMMVGDTDELTEGDVSRLQTFLLKEGLYLQSPTGTFDAETQAALIAWQKKHQLESEEGRVGAMTREKIAANLAQFYLTPKWSEYKTGTQFERQVQQQLIAFSSLFERHVPWLVKIILGLVLARLALVSALLVVKKFMPKKVSQHWRGGVSVVIPVFNEEENIESTLRSVLITARKRMEVLVVDDGSTDRTVSVIKKIIRKNLRTKKSQPFYHEIRLIKMKNSGKAAALNRGFEAAKYGVVVTMDGDTIFTPETIPNLVRPFGNAKIAAVAGKVAVTNSKNFINIFQQLEYIIAQNVDKAAFSFLNAVGVIPGPVGAWRKSVVKAQGGFSQQTMVEDQDLTLAILAAGHLIAYEAKAVAFTETPFTIWDFVKQRVRWVFGTIQCFLKYVWRLRRNRSISLNLIILPNTLTYSILLPLFYPLMDVVFLISIFAGYVDQIWLLYLLFMGIDLGYAAVAFTQEKAPKQILLWLPLQRIFYRFILYYVVTKSLVKVIEGSEVLWNKVRKRGDATQHHLGLICQEVQVELARTS